MNSIVSEKKGNSSENTSSVLLVIPAYNEADSIKPVIERLNAEYPQYDYVIVNDGSTDATADVCRQNGYRFLDLPTNLGLSGAFQAGIKYAHRHDYSCAIQFDADGQHLPEYIDALIQGLEQSDIVIGSRFILEEKPRNMRMIGSSLLSMMIRLTTGKTLTDPTSGMRAYNKRAIKELAFGPNLGPEPDTIAYLMRKKQLAVSEMPVEMGPRIAGESYLNWRNSSRYMARMALSVLIIQFFR